MASTGTFAKVPSRTFLKLVLLDAPLKDRWSTLHLDLLNIPALKVMLILEPPLQVEKGLVELHVTDLVLTDDKVGVDTTTVCRSTPEQVWEPVAPQPLHALDRPLERPL